MKRNKKIDCLFAKMVAFNGACVVVIRRYHSSNNYALLFSQVTYYVMKPVFIKIMNKRGERSFSPLIYLQVLNKHIEMMTYMLLSAFSNYV